MSGHSRQLYWRSRVGAALRGRGSNQALFSAFGHGKRNGWRPGGRPCVGLSAHRKRLWFVGSGVFSGILATRGRAGRVDQAGQGVLHKDAYLAVKDNAPREVLSIFEVDAVDADAAGGEPIFTPDGRPVGRVTSGAYGYSVGKSLALGYADPNVAQPGDPVEIFILGKPHTAQLLAKPPFDPDGLRLRDARPLVMEAVK